jgi:23S rRNA-/tRNA-specific pseudouridylate synthase
MILQWYRQQRSDHYRFPSSSDDIQVVYESKNYFVVNKDDLVPIDAYEAPSQVNVTQQMKKWFAKRETERFLHQEPPPTDEQTEHWKKGLAQRVEDIRYCHRLDLDKFSFSFSRRSLCPSFRNEWLHVFRQIIGSQLSRLQSIH